MTYFLHFCINCSYVRVLFGHYGTEHVTHLVNYGQNNPHGMNKLAFISIALTQHYKDYWHVNPITIDDLYNFV